MQDPKIDFNHFDFIVAPEHDGINGDNVINTKGAIHYLSEKEIEENKDYLKSFIKQDERKVWCLIMGGPTKYYDYSTKNMKHIFSMFYKLMKKHNFQLVVIPSMRTPKRTVNLADELLGKENLVITNIDKKAYLSGLSLAKYIVVTCDSTSMISEAAITGKPIYIADLPAKRNDHRFKMFRELFGKLNITKNLNEKLDIWNYKSLNETSRIADEIKKKIS